MAYRLDSTDHIGEDLTRVATEQFEAAIAALEPADEVRMRRHLCEWHSAS